jgi:hypothetical protein
VIVTLVSVEAMPPSILLTVRERLDPSSKTVEKSMLFPSTCFAITPELWVATGEPVACFSPT